jgi:hypothetical protein
MMARPKFLTGRHDQRGLLWAAIDPDARYAEAAIGERRFAAYLKPFPDEDSAKQALLDAGAKWIEAEGGRRHAAR